MKNKIHNIVRGVAVIGAGLAITIAQPAFADNNRNNQQDRRNDQRDNRQDNRNDQRNNRWDNRNDQREDHRNDRRDDRRDDHRFDNHRNVPQHNPQPNWNQPRYDSQPNWNQPRYNPQPSYNPAPNWNQQNVTLEGTVINDLRGNSFTLRTSNGQTYVVQVQGNEAYGLNRNDVVRVFGTINGNRFNALSMRILANR